MSEPTLFEQLSPDELLAEIDSTLGKLMSLVDYDPEQITRYGLGLVMTGKAIAGLDKAAARAVIDEARSAGRKAAKQ